MQTELEQLKHILAEFHQLGEAYIELQQDLNSAGEMILFYGDQLMAARATIALLEQQIKLQGVH